MAYQVSMVVVVEGRVFAAAWANAPGMSINRARLGD
jgi:hypothetical protein